MVIEMVLHNKASLSMRFWVRGGGGGRSCHYSGHPWTLWDCQHSCLICASFSGPDSSVILDRRAIQPYRPTSNVVVHTSISYTSWILCTQSADRVREPNKHPPPPPPPPRHYLMITRWRLQKTGRVPAVHLPCSSDPRGP